MHDAARTALVGIVARHGVSIGDDARRCEGLLRDYCGQYRREVSVLVAALEEAIPSELLAGKGIPHSLLLARLVARLVDHRAISEDAARWAVVSWAVALGVGSDDVPFVAEAPPSASVPPHAQPPIAAVAAPARSAFVVSAAGDADFVTISEALARAADGAKIVVRPGIYHEGLVLERPVEVVGDGAVDQIVVRSAASSCVRVATDGAVVRGLTLRCAAGQRGDGFFAVDVSRGDLHLENCDVASNSLAGIGIHGAEARPTVLRCAIHGGADAGVYVFDGAAGVVDGCDVYENANVGVAITSGGDPIVRNCRIFRGRNAGIVSWNGGRGRVQGCEIFGNAQAGVGISDGGDPIVTRCEIHDGGNAGIFVHDGGRGTIIGCDVSGHGETEIAITRGGLAVVRDCAIHDGKVGVYVSEHGGGQIRGCTIAGNASAGVVLSAGAAPAIRDCSIVRNGGAAVVAEAGAAGEIVGCDLRGNAFGAWSVVRGSGVRASGNKE